MSARSESRHLLAFNMPSPSNSAQQLYGMHSKSELDFMQNLREQKNSKVEKI
jgi:hypothetical protein